MHDDEAGAWARENSELASGHLVTRPQEAADALPENVTKAREMCSEAREGVRRS